MKNNWKNLQDLLFFQEGPGVRKNQFRNNGVKLLNVGNINDKKLNLDTTSIFISEEEAYGKYSHFLVENGDLLICCSGIVVDNFHNKIVFAEEKHLPLCLNTSTMRFRTLNDDILNIKYFYYFLMTKLFKEQLQKLITGSAQLNFGPSHIKKIFMPIVELNKQKQVAKTLDKAQELIDLRKKSIAKLDELAKSIFIDMFGNPVSNPKGWEVKKIADLGKVQTGNTPPRAEADNYGNYLEWIKSDNILRDKIGITEAREYLSQKGAKKGRIAEKGSLLFTCIAGSMLSIGNLGYVDRTVAFNQQINSLTPINNNSLYLYFLFTLSKQVFEESSTKSMKIMVNKSTFEGLIFPVAPIELQNKFASIIEKIEEQKSLYENELEKLEENFQALLQQSFQE